MTFSSVTVRPTIASLLGVSTKLAFMPGQSAFVLNARRLAIVAAPSISNVKNLRLKRSGRLKVFFGRRSRR